MIGKSWADHCSSDEESDDDLPPKTLSAQDIFGGGDVAVDDDEEDAAAAEEDSALGDGNSFRPNAARPPKDYSFLLTAPPPYTAYVGNLNYDIRSSQELQEDVEKMLESRKCVAIFASEGDAGGERNVRVQSARLMTERGGGQSRGYGYLEFESPEEVRAMAEGVFLPSLCVVLGFLASQCAKRRCGKALAAGPGLFLQLRIFSSRLFARIVCL